MNPILERVRKLRALSHSSNKHEAATAAAIAEKLIQEHRLSEAELDAGDGEGFGEPTVVDTFGSGRLVHWRVQLIMPLARLHGCAHAFFRVGRGPKSRIECTVLGAREDVETVTFLYGWLSAEIERLADEAGKGRGISWRNSYKFGCVLGIRDAMEEAKRRVDAGATSTALAVLDSRLATAQQQIEGMGKDGGTRRTKPTLDDEAFDAGKRDGRDLHERAGRSLKG